MAREDGPGPESPDAPQEAIVVHEDALDAACQAASRSIDQLIWQGSSEVAKAVTLFGPGIVVLPMFGKVSGVSSARCLEYGSHPKRAAKGGLMDRVDLELKFGPIDPGRLVEELTGGKNSLEQRLQALSNEELQEEVLALQDWRQKANGRIKTLERRAAWAFLGVAGEGTVNQAEIKKAFKRRALELHPDKGGDADRFRLLQEMRDLLVEPKSYELEGEKEAQAQKEKEPGADRKAKDNKAQGDEEDEADISSDDSWDANEELRKMFPKKKKRHKKAQQGEDPEGEGDFMSRDQDFNRSKFEAARRKLHRNFIDLWSRACQLAEEIKRSQTTSTSGDAMRHLRKFVDRFANLEVSKLKENDPKKAERIFRRFLEQGSEVLCAAGAVDPAATVSVVAMQVNCPLLQMAPCADLKERCTALLEAISSLPLLVGKYVGSLEAKTGNRKHAAEAGAFRIRLLVPDEEALLQREGLEIPGVSEVEVELPPGSTLDDLRAAALQMCGGHSFGGTPRLFCRGCLLVGSGSKPLESIPEVAQDLLLQCLPSNRALRAPRASHPNSATRAGPQMTATTAGPKPATRPSPHSQVTASNGGGYATTPQAHATAIAVAKAEKDLKACAERRAAEQRAKETLEQKAAVENEKEQEEDSFFDDFFADAKKAADEKEQKVKEEEKRRAEEQRRLAEAKDEEERKRLEEKVQRRAAQEQGKNALEARLKAQKQAAEAKKKLEAERKQEKRKEEQQQARMPPTSLQPSQPKPAQAQEEIWSDALVPAAKDDEQQLRRLRDSWDESWEHPCAGEKRCDGTAIFCGPCEGWISLGDRFDHRDFELHCEKVGHYGWID